METIVEFNGVTMLLTTGQHLGEIQNYTDRIDTVDLVLSVYSHELRILKIKLPLTLLSRETVILNRETVMYKGSPLV